MKNSRLRFPAANRVRGPKRFLTLRRNGTEVRIRCTEETLENYWGSPKGAAKVLRFPKPDWKVLNDETD